MARVKKSTAQKEQELLDIIKEAKEKLIALQNKKRIDLGELACKYGLHEFDISTIEESFKELSLQLGNKKND